MKCLIVSDIHGDYPTFFQICQREDYQILIALGDSELSAKALRDVDYLVHGNAYQDLGQPAIVTSIKGLKILMVHGHLEHVQRGDDGLLKKAESTGATVLMHGHTHRARFSKTQDKYLLNPGAIVGPRGHWPASYAILDIKSHQFTVTFKTVDQQILAQEEGKFA